MHLFRVVAVALVVAVAAACGGDPDVSADASAELQERVAEIRTLAEARQTDALIAEIDALYVLVEQLRVDGEITDEVAGEIEASVVAVRDNVSSITTTTTTTTTTAPPDEDDDKDKGRGNGNGNEGGGNDDDDDD